MVKSLSQGQVTILKKSFRELQPEQFTSHFYFLLFETCPELKPLFVHDMTDQKIKFMSVLELIIFSFKEQMHGQYVLEDSILLPLRKLGILHEKKGVDPLHYIIGNNLLLETIEFCLVTQYDNEVKKAWSLALQHITQAMLNTKLRIPRPGKNRLIIFLIVTFKGIFQKLKR